ncbi:hypothetical protein JMJ55_28785 [Belnapia sp. T6]|uniref:Uncharacterized protein n=1 Tax=Belnapia mucosa TaxID=2804532 RepID=A0ABS1VCG3_9PROT|nr:hypothetical protein [Belnapia mucosa]MBL6459320.1 hypothetical protein [Belnapia mucosa]
MLATVTTLLREPAKDDDIVLADEAAAGNVEAWESLRHANVIIVIISRFRTRFAANGSPPQSISANWSR